MMDKKDVSISQKNAKSFYDEYLKDNNSGIFSIIGSWGTGKSTIKEKLLELINSRNNDKTVTAVYDALQYEETSQVTSQLYNVIAKPLSRWNFCTRNKLKAAAQLKKESAAQSISTSQIWSLFIVGIGGFLISKISKLPELNDLISEFGIILGFVPTQNPIFGNKLLISFLIFILTFWKRNKLLTVITGLFPRKSHVEVLESIKFRQKNLIILIDEIDRLSPESMKLLFDEILIIRDSFRKAKINFKIIIFYDEDVVLHNYKLINIYEPHIFLQKFYDAQYRLPRAVLFDDLYVWVVGIQRNNSSILKLPTAKIIHHIADNIASFREKDKLIEFLEKQIPRFISDDIIRSRPLDVDIFIFSISLRFYFDLRPLYDENKGGKLYTVYVDKGINILNHIYSVSQKELRQLIESELKRLVKPYNNGTYSQNNLIKQTILNAQTNSINDYCQNIVNNIEFFYWSDFSWALNNIEEFKHYLTEKNIDFTDLIFNLSNWLQNTINQNDSARLTNERDNFSIKHIQGLYIKRIECIRFFLYLYIKLGNPIDSLIPVDKNKSFDCLIICALLKFNRKTRENHVDVVEVDSFIHSAIPDNDDTNILNLIKKRVSELKDISLLFNDSLFLYQACDLILQLSNNWGDEVNYTYTVYARETINNNLLSKNSLIYTIIFQNNPLGLEFNPAQYEALSKYEFNSEIKKLLEHAAKNRINLTGRDYYINPW
jgi:hypothetical protein